MKATQRQQCSIARSGNSPCTRAQRHQVKQLGSRLRTKQRQQRHNLLHTICRGSRSGGQINSRGFAGRHHPPPPPTQEDTGLPLPGGKFPIPVLGMERSWDRDLGRRVRDGNRPVQGLGNGIGHRSVRLRAPAAMGTAAGCSPPARAGNTDMPRGHHGAKMTGKAPRCHP